MLSHLLLSSCEAAHNLDLKITKYNISTAVSHLQDVLRRLIQMEKYDRVNPLHEKFFNDMPNTKKGGRQTQRQRWRQPWRSSSSCWQASLPSRQRKRIIVGSLMQNQWNLKPRKWKGQKIMTHLLKLRRYWTSSLLMTPNQPSVLLRWYPKSEWQTFGFWIVYSFFMVTTISSIILIFWVTTS